MWTLLCNVPIARRLSMCHVVDDDGTLRFSSKPAGPCLRFLYEQEQLTFRIHGTEDGEQFVVDLRLP